MSEVAVKKSWPLKVIQDVNFFMASLSNLILVDRFGAGDIGLFTLRILNWKLCKESNHFAFGWVIKLEPRLKRNDKEATWHVSWLYKQFLLIVREWNPSLYHGGWNMIAWYSRKQNSHHQTNHGFINLSVKLGDLFCSERHDLFRGVQTCYEWCGGASTFAHDRAWAHGWWSFNVEMNATVILLHIIIKQDGYWG